MGGKVSEKIGGKMSEKMGEKISSIESNYFVSCKKFNKFLKKLKIHSSRVKS